MIVLSRTIGRVRGPGGETLEQLVEESGVDYDLLVTRSYTGAFEQARKAAAHDQYFVAVGDDRLVHEVVNGMLGENPATDSGMMLAVVPGPRRSEFTRTFGLPAQAADAISGLGTEPYFAVDAGKVTFSHKGRIRSRCFINLAEVGIGAGIVRRSSGRLPSFLGRGGELLAFWASLATYRPARARLALDKRTLDLEICNLVVANGQFYRDGMRIAPKAHPADGRFDALVMKGAKRDYVAALTKARKGDHVPDASIREYMAERVEVHSDRPLEIQADGKFLGQTPATFEIIPNAFNLKI